MKKLLIHNDNTALVDNFSSSIKVSFSNEIDSYIDNSIIEKLEKEDFDIIYIKDNLSSNYLELYGLRVAYHVRLSDRLKDKRFMPIVILSDIDETILNRLEPMGRILFTKNIFLIKNTKEDFDNFQNRDLKSLTTKEYQNSFLNLINVDAPENSTSHNIANEWAIYRWSELLKIDSEAIKTNNNKISSMLYFKYLLALNPIIELSSNSSISYPINSGKILYIDDEYNMGWSDILKFYFSKNPNVKFETLEYDFKENNIFKVNTDIRKKVKISNPDLVILDLRLIANDHTDTNREDINKYSGIQVLNSIKEINKGIQVLMLTATSKSTILDKLYEHDILGYIKKEHPTDKNIRTKENFNKLAYLVGNGFEKSYLKEIWTIQNTILKLDLSNEIKFEVKSVFEILDSDMEKRYTYAMLSIHQTLEEINNIFINDKKSIWRDTQQSINIKNTTKNKIVEILKTKLKLHEFNKEINNITHIRNNIMHPNNTKIIINKSQIIEWFKMLQAILEKVSDDKTNH